MFRQLIFRYKKDSCLRLSALIRTTFSYKNPLFGGFF